MGRILISFGKLIWWTLSPIGHLFDAQMARDCLFDRILQNSLYDTIEQDYLYKRFGRDFVTGATPLYKMFSPTMSIWEQEAYNYLHLKMVKCDAPKCTIQGHRACIKYKQN